MQRLTYLGTEVSLTYHGRRAGLSPSAMAPSQQVGSGQPTLEDEIWRKIEELLKRWRKAEEMRLKSQRLASLEHDARQPHLVMEAEGPADMKTRERTEGATKAVQAMHWDNVPASRVDPGPKTTSTSLGVRLEPLVLPCRDDVVVENGAAAPKSYPPLLKMRSPTAAGDLLPTGEASIVTRTTYNQPPLRLYSTGETNSKKTHSRTPILSVSYDSRFRRNRLLAAPSCRGFVEAKYGQNRTFNPGGSQARPRACSFLGTWRALLCGEVMRVGVAGDDLQRFWRIDDSRFKNLQEKETNRLRHTYCGQSFFSDTARLKKPCRRRRLEAMRAEGTNGGHDVEDGSRL